MSRYLTKDIWIGLTFLLVATVYWLESDKIRISPLDGPVNASGLPKSLAIALGGLALVLIIRSLIATTFWGRPGDAGQSGSSLAEVLQPHFRAAGMIAIGIGYLLVVSWLGYAFAIVALLLVVSLYNGASLSRISVAIALAGGVLYHLMFVEFLGIPLPQGLILGPLFG